MGQPPQVPSDLQAQIRALEGRLFGTRIGGLDEQLQDVEQGLLEPLAEGETAQAGELVELRNEPADQLVAGLDRLRCLIATVGRTRSTGGTLRASPFCRQLRQKSRPGGSAPWTPDKG